MLTQHGSFRKGEKDMNKNNAEGYPDPTAYMGLEEIVKEEVKRDRQIARVIRVAKTAAELGGFEIEGRIVLREKKTGKVFR